jgi:pyrroloquinoline quinone (PQQ) biosynthesis protein C
MEPFSEGGPADARRPTARDAARFEWFWCELSLIGERWSVLHHPFLVRCLAGELTWGQLQLFAEEFDHLVTASARTAQAASDTASGLVGLVLWEHAEQADADVDLWREFARSIGWATTSGWYYAAEPCTQTDTCARLWGPATRTLAADIITLYAIDCSQLQFARMLADLLPRRYGVDEGIGVAYFRRHREPDRADRLAAALQGLLGTDDHVALLRQAEAVHRGFWEMLDALEERDAAVS